MSIIEAIQKGNALVQQKTGIRADPVFVRLVEMPGKRVVWRLIYKAELFYPKYAQEEGAVTDGGEYIVEVDQATGSASAFGL
jgi:hypothetical protein